MQPLLSTIKRPSSAPCAQEVLEAVPSLFWFIRRHMRQYRQGLSVPQFRALVKIRNQPAATLSAVAEHLGESLPTASRVIATLAKKGYLTRGGCLEDRRRCALDLTDQGRAIVDRAHEATESVMERQLEQLSTTEREKVREASIILRQAFEPMMIHADGEGGMSRDGAIVAGKSEIPMERPPRRRIKNLV